MSREATADVEYGQCSYCIDRYPGRQLPVRDGVLMTHGRPVERRDPSGESVEPCPGAGTEPE